MEDIKESSSKLTESPLTLLLKSPQKNAIHQNNQQQQQNSSLLLPVIPAGLPPVLDTRPQVTIQNTVSTLNLGCTLDLLKLSVRIRNSEYNPQRFPGCILRILEPKSTALVFKSGKMVVTGARSEELSKLAARKYARIIQKIGFKVRAKHFTIRNLVGTCDVRFPIKVDALNQVHAQFSSYEPELFPALIYRVVKPRVSLMIFVNGKMVVTGAKSMEEIYDALDMILPILKSFRKQ